MKSVLDSFEGRREALGWAPFGKQDISITILREAPAELTERTPTPMMFSPIAMLRKKSAAPPPSDEEDQRHAEAIAGQEDAIRAKFAAKRAAREAKDREEEAALAAEQAADAAVRKAEVERLRKVKTETKAEKDQREHREADQLSRRRLQAAAKRAAEPEEAKAGGDVRVQAFVDAELQRRRREAKAAKKPKAAAAVRQSFAGEGDDEGGGAGEGGEEHAVPSPPVWAAGGGKGTAADRREYELRLARITDRREMIAAIRQQKEQQAELDREVGGPSRLAIICISRAQAQAQAQAEPPRPCPRARSPAVSRAFAATTHQLVGKKSLLPHQRAQIVALRKTGSFTLTPSRDRRSGGFDTGLSGTSTTSNNDFVAQEEEKARRRILTQVCNDGRVTVVG